MQDLTLFEENYKDQVELLNTTIKALEWKNTELEEEKKILNQNVENLVFEHKKETQKLNNRIDYLEENTTENNKIEDIKYFHDFRETQEFEKFQDELKFLWDKVIIWEYKFYKLILSLWE